MSVSNEGLLAEYYAKRAREYERIYDKPERQEDLEALRGLLSKLLAGQDVLEIACGTGYWTHIVARTAHSILATDLNEEVLQIAMEKSFFNCNVSFRRADAFHLEELKRNDFTACLATFWWSHLPRAEIDPFLKQLHGVLSPETLVLFVDNRFVAGSSTPLSRRDGTGNTYQIRRLDSGESFEVLKNFPDRREVEAVLSNHAAEIQWRELNYYWLVAYRTR